MHGDAVGIPHPPVVHHAVHRVESVRRISSVGNIEGFANHIEDEIRIHAVLSEDIALEEQIAESQRLIEAIDGVKEAEFSDKDHELALWIAEKGEVFSIYEGETNPR